MVVALGKVAAMAIARRDRSPLVEFWEQHRVLRLRALDAFQVEIDVARARNDLERLRALEHTKFMAHGSVTALFERASSLPLTPRPVSKVAADELSRRALRIEALAAMDADTRVVLRDVDRARMALEALGTADFHERLAASGVESRHADGELVERCLGLCRVPGSDDDAGLGAACRDAFLRDGTALVVAPHVTETEEATPELYERVMERYGEYSTDLANEVLADDEAAFYQSMLGHALPQWAEGKNLGDAARDVQKRAKALAARDRAIEAAAERFRVTLEKAAASKHVVVEWIAG